MSQYSGFERKVAFVLTKLPRIKLIIKKAYQKLNYLRYRKDYTFKSNYKITKLTYRNAESFFGYYDKSPINITNEYIIFQTSNIDTKAMPDPSTPVNIVLYSIKNSTYEVIDESHSYNWQQGTKLMWINTFEFAYNCYDATRKNYIAKQYNIKTKNYRIINFPIYDCFEDNFSISLNFDRLNIGRADYSYGNRNAKIDWSDNDNDGLYFTDLKVNTHKLIITLQDIINLNMKDSMNNAKHKFNHIMISPNGKKFMFMHRWFTSDNRRYDTLYVSNIDGTGIKIMSDDDMVSHCYWYDNDNIFAYLRDKITGDKYYLININTFEKSIVGDSVINKFGDGHPSVYKKQILFDTYPDKSRMKSMFIFDNDNKQLKDIGSFLEPFDFYAETRCDLHPRFSFDGKKVFFDSVHSGKRQLYMMDIS